MPLYEYECQSCEGTVEVLVRQPSDADEVTCPNCEGDKMDRVMSAPAAPSISQSSSLPVAGAGESCGAPRCCGGGCRM